MGFSRGAVREVGDVAVIDLSGDLAIGQSSAFLRDTVRELILSHRNRIVLNFRDVKAIDSAGIGELVAAYVLAKSRGATLKLLNPPLKVHDILNLTQLSNAFEIFTDEAMVLRSFE